jgi:hypothetical protein
MIPAQVHVISGSFWFKSRTFVVKITISVLPLHQIVLQIALLQRIQCGQVGHFRRNTADNRLVAIVGGGFILLRLLHVTSLPLGGLRTCLTASGIWVPRNCPSVHPFIRLLKRDLRALYIIHALLLNCSNVLCFRIVHSRNRLLQRSGRQFFVWLEK